MSWSLTDSGSPNNGYPETSTADGGLGHVPVSLRWRPEVATTGGVIDVDPRALRSGGTAPPTVDIPLTYRRVRDG